MAIKRVVKKQEKQAVAADIKETVQNVEKTVKEKVEEKAPVMKEAAEKKTAAEVKTTAEVKETAEKASAEPKETVKKVRKAPAKAPVKAPIKKEVKTKIMIQHQGKEIDTKDLIAAVKKEWVKGKNKVTDIKSMDLYIKPEDDAVYYVVNEDFTGKVVL